MPERARTSPRRRLPASGVGVLLLVATSTAGAVADTPPPANWVMGATSTPPALASSMRLFPGMAADPVGDTVVLHGGIAATAAPGDPALADTWTWQDGTWTPRCGTSEPGATAPCGPGQRVHHGLATGPGGVILFGGAENQLGGPIPVHSDTWRWTGSAWTQVCADGACGPVADVAMAMAGTGTRAVLFGGLDVHAGPAPVDDTWVFDGATWTQVCGTGIGTPCGPTARAGAAMAWDGEQFVLFGGGGLGGGPAPSGDTWVLGPDPQPGDPWTQVCADGACGPAARSFAGAATLSRPDDETRRGALLAGGGTFDDPVQTQHRDQWLFRDGSWAQLPTPWPSTPLTFEDGPPDGSTGLMLPRLAGLATTCQVVLLGLDLGAMGEPATRLGGWDVDGDGVPGGCDEELPVPPRPSGRGYRLVGPDGGVFDFGEASFTGSLAGTRLNGPVVAAAGSPTGRGYWLVGADGGVFAFGDAGFFGSSAHLDLRRPVSAVTATPWGEGYWLVGADGGVFAFGDAGFFGSAAHLGLDAPVVAVARTATGEGYWLVGADGGVFAFGDAGFFGSAAHLDLNAPIVGLAPTPTGAGYWLVGADGAVFAFGDAGFFGSAAHLDLNAPIVGLAPTPTGAGYWLVGAGRGGVRVRGRQLLRLGRRPRPPRPRRRHRPRLTHAQRSSRKDPVRTVTPRWRVPGHRRPSTSTPTAPRLAHTSTRRPEVATIAGWGTCSPVRRRDRMARRSRRATA
ncbi:MAG: hypothetical protein M5U14_06000 [Acidimicrobiia bacterium]|nr:hypothetical protein [Acidimicrobiia bacterium]